MKKVTNTVKPVPSHKTKEGLAELAMDWRGDRIGEKNFERVRELIKQGKQMSDASFKELQGYHASYMGGTLLKGAEQ
jgi:hypothetical protein